MEAEPSKGAGLTPWFDLLFDHCEAGDLVLELDRFPEEVDDDGYATRSMFVLTVVEDAELAAQWQAERIEDAAERVCRSLGIAIAEAA